MTLRRQEIDELAWRAKTDPKALAELVKECEDLVISTAWKKAATLMRKYPEDTLQAGRLAIVSAVSGYTNRKWAFSAVAYYDMQSAWRVMVRNYLNIIRTRRAETSYAHEHCQGDELDHPECPIKPIDPKDGPDANFEKSDLAEYCVKGLDMLSNREQEVIIRRFGLFEVEPCKLKVLAEEMGIGKERVRQVESEALSKLRRLKSLSR